jgi:nickel-type superoxide dismutase maturation protease
MVHSELTVVTQTTINPPSPRELLLWLLRRRRRFRVAGDSMRPLLAPGDEVLVDTSAYRDAIPSEGDIVTAQHPYHSDVHLIKRVQSVDPDGACVLHGDNPDESTDSRSFGSVKGHRLIGRVTSRFD